MLSLVDDCVEKLSLISFWARADSLEGSVSPVLRKESKTLDPYQPITMVSKSAQMRTAHRTRYSIPPSHVSIVCPFHMCPCPESSPLSIVTRTSSSGNVRVDMPLPDHRRARASFLDNSYNVAVNKVYM